MIKQIEFTKMVASGNDFVIIDNRKPLNHAHRRLSILGKQICDRKYGVGADGLLILEKSKKADLRMRIFNPDGSEPKMCGNGLRCAALCQSAQRKAQSAKLRIETKAGIIQAGVNKDSVKIKMSEPKGIKLDLPIKISKRTIRANLIDTGVPHTVVFVAGLDKIDVVNIGRQIRFYKRFLPAGVNVDFVQIIDDNNIELRTYERGVEDETLACGTGAVAAALIVSCQLSVVSCQNINVYTKGGEVLKVGFKRIGDKFKNIWLEGKVRIVYKGVYYV
jgi:diaminopimelate epimerase